MPKFVGRALTREEAAEAPTGCAECGRDPVVWVRDRPEDGLGTSLGYCEYHVRYGGWEYCGEVGKSPLRPATEE